MPERALARAEELDEHMTNHGKPVGLLHGRPIGVKNHIGMKGLGYNCAFVAWVGTAAEDDALLLKIL